MIRTGAQNLRAAEAVELGELSTAQRPRPNTETRRQAFIQADGQRSDVDNRLAAAAAAERELLDLVQSLALIQARLGRSTAELDELFDERWRTQAGRLANTPWFGQWRRRRFLAPLGLPADADTAEVCAGLAGLAASDARYRQLCIAVDRDIDDPHRENAVAQVDGDLIRASTELIVGVVADRAAAGVSRMRELARETGTGCPPDWHQRDEALRYVGGWP